MICYKDMSFCASDCTNTSCHRHWTDEKSAAARKWWGKDNPPVAFMDFSGKCDDYQARTSRSSGSCAVSTRPDCLRQVLQKTQRGLEGQRHGHDLHAVAPDVKDGAGADGY